MLHVDGLASEYAVRTMQFRRLGRAVRPDGLVFMLGYPRGEKWRASVTPHVVADVSPTTVQFEAEVLPGASGGALLNERGEIVGVVQRYDGSRGSATRIDVVMKLLASWGYRVRLLPAPTMESVERRDSVSAWRNLGTPAQRTVARAEIRGAALSRDGQWLVAVDYRPTAVNVIRVETGAVLHRFSSEALDSRGDQVPVAISGDGQLVAASGADGRVVVWETEFGRVVFSEKVSASNRIVSVWFSDDATKLLVLGGSVSADEAYLVAVRDLRSGKTVLSWRVAEARHGFMRASQSDLVVGCRTYIESSCEIWNSSVGVRQQALMLQPRGDEAVQSYAVAQDGRYLAWGGWGTIHLVDASNRRELRVMQNDRRSWRRVSALAFAPSGEWLIAASGGSDQENETVTNRTYSPAMLTVWNVSTGAMERSWQLEKGSDSIFFVGIGADGRNIISASRLEGVTVWTPSR